MSNIPPEEPIENVAPPAAAATIDYPRAGGVLAPSADEAQKAMLCWILTIFFGFVPGLIFFLTSDGKPYLKRQGALALTLGIVTAVGVFISIPLVFVLIGILTYIAFPVYHLVISIMGAIASKDGKDFSPKYLDKLCMSMFKL